MKKMKQLNFLNANYKQIKNNLEKEDIFKFYLNDMDSSYKQNNSTERIVIDYIAGMTDSYFINEFNTLKKI